MTYSKGSGGVWETLLHLGLQSTGHGPHEPIEVTFVDKDHPVVQGMEDWKIEKGVIS